MKDILDFLNINGTGKKLTFTDSVILHITEGFLDFDENIFNIDIAQNHGFNVKLIISFDNVNWSIPKDLSDITEELIMNKELSIINNTPFIVRFKIFIRQIDESNNSLTQYNQNVNENQSEIVLNDISYGGVNLYDKIKVTEYVETIKRFPSWNLYDNQQISIDRWKAECIAVTVRTGHQCIYFKTEPDNEEIRHTLSALCDRSVVAIKKMYFSSPENELPTDRNIFTEWDMPMMDEFVVHIVDDLFKQIFGNTIPQNKDFLYIPILNKLYTVNSVQPGIKFMGSLGWWEVFLTKYEEDEIVEKNIDSVIQMVQNTVTNIPNLDEESISDIYDHFENMMDDGLITAQKQLTITTEEKKKATQGYSNKLVDSTFYIDLKDTEIQREWYAKRLKIVSINPDNLAFPLSVYNFNSVTDRTIGLIYNLTNAVSINKFPIDIKKDTEINISFNFVFLKRYTNEIIDINCNGIPIFTISLKQKSLVIKRDNLEFNVTYKFEENEFYQINISNNKVMIFQLTDNNKELVHIFEYDLFVNENETFNLISNEIILYGGPYYLGQFQFSINKNKIIDDKTLPLLKMNVFGT